MSGSKHIMYLVEKGLISVKPSSILETLYSTGASSKPLNSKALAEEKDPSRNTTTEPEEEMVLTPDSAGVIAKALEVPELEAELDRAIWQVEKSIKENEEKLKAKHKADEARSKSSSTTSEKEDI